MSLLFCYYAMMFSMYYKIYSAFKFDDRETWELKFMIKWNQVRSDWTLSPYQKFFIYTQDDFESVFKKKYNLDEYNLWIEWKILEVQMVPTPKNIIDKIPEKKS